MNRLYSDFNSLSNGNSPFKWVGEPHFKRAFRNADGPSAHVSEKNNLPCLQAFFLNAVSLQLWRFRCAQMARGGHDRLAV